jgi:YidC/Oxa1 family membrane protein insertase
LPLEALPLYNSTVNSVSSQTSKGSYVSDNSTENNQRSLQAIILCVLVAVLYTQFFIAPKDRARQQQLRLQQQAAQTTTNATSVTSPVAAPQGGVTVVTPQSPAVARAHPAKAEIEAAPSSKVNLGNATIAFSHLGARVRNFKLTSYKLVQGSEEALDLVDSPEGAPLPLGVYVGSESDERVRYALAAVNGAAPGSQSVELNVQPGSTVALDFAGTLPSGAAITKRVTLTGGSYLFKVDVALDRPVAGGQPVWLEWSHFYSSAVEKELRIKHTLTYLDDKNKIQHVQLDQIVEGVRAYGTSKWVSLGDTYFTSAIIPTTSVPNTELGREGDLFIGRVGGTATGGTFLSYVGPKDYKTLEAAGYSLERSIDLGWFAFLALPLLWLLHFLYGLLGNYGVAIIALTLIVKTVMLPLSRASFESAKKMQDLAPEIKALRERIKDPTQLNQETFALYKRKGVNPMGGCLPVAVQIPVFLGLYNALLNAIELRHAPFALWITDLSSPEKLQLFGIGVPVMVLLMAASMIYQQWMTPNPSADPAQQKMMMIMPVVFAGMFIVFPMPAGLVLYWLVNNIISIIQQLYMRNAQRGSVYVGTMVANAVIFGVGFLLTLI